MKVYVIHLEGYSCSMAIANSKEEAISLLSVGKDISLELENIEEYELDGFVFHSDFI
jgi:hypothetical protein